uniref:CSD domain-containing protein n=1 Tax=Helobdella robusta TaxID=6412 RepID=T1EKQ6_HELRO
MPSPLPTKRNRTYSQSQKASAGPILNGVVKSFCRQKGHGFIQPNSGGEPLFVHISDIETDCALKDGDEVTYKLCPIPPKMEKFSAVHVKMLRPKEGVEHEKW